MKASAAAPSSLFSVSPNPTPPRRLSLHKPKYPSFLFKSLTCCIHSDSNRNPNISPPSINPNNTISRFSCSAITFSSSPTTDFPSSTATKLHHLTTEFHCLPDPRDRLKRLLHYASLLPPFPDSARLDSNRVMGCTARVWLQAQLDHTGKMRFWADSDSDITKGFCACLLSVLDGAAPEEVLAVKTEDLAALNVGLPSGERSRVNTWHNVLVSMQKRTKKLVAEKEGKQACDPFPSLIVTSDGIQAKGSYAEAQVCNKVI